MVDPSNKYLIIVRKRIASRTGRDADPRRTLPLNGAAWQRLRERVLARDPICQHCFERGHVVPATDVDHVSGDPSDNSLENLQSLCHSCHSIKTASDLGKRVMAGCDVDGLPAAWKKSPATERSRPLIQPSFNSKSDNEP